MAHRVRHQGVDDGAKAGPRRPGGRAVVVAGGVARSITPALSMPASRTAAASPRPRRPTCVSTWTRSTGACGAKACARSTRRTQRWGSGTVCQSRSATEGRWTGGCDVPLGQRSREPRARPDGGQGGGRAFDPTTRRAYRSSTRWIIAALAGSCTSQNTRSPSWWKGPGHRH
jgi:hypothetical protein